MLADGDTSLLDPTDNDAEKVGQERDDDEEVSLVQMSFGGEQSDSNDVVENSSPNSTRPKAFQSARDEDSSGESNIDENQNATPNESPRSYVHEKHFDENTGRQIPTFLDTLVMPPYPDEANIDIADINGKEESGVEVVLDTGAANRNRHAGVRRYQRGLKENKWKQEQNEEHKYETARTYAPGDSLSHSSDEVSMVLKNENDAALSLEESSPVKKTDNTIFPPQEIGKELEKKISMEGENVDHLYDEYAWWRPSSITAGFDRLLEVAEWNKEMKRILSHSLLICCSIKGR